MPGHVATPAGLAGPTRSLVTAWTKIPERGSVLGMRFFLWLVNALGYWPAIACLYPVVAIETLLNVRARRATRQWLMRAGALSAQSSRLTRVRAYFQHQFVFAVSMIDRLWFWQGRMQAFQFEFDGREALESIRHRGAMVVGAHFGCFDLLRILAEGQKKQVTVVMYTAASAKFTDLLQKVNPDFSLRVLRADQGLETVFALQSEVEAQGLVAVLADRHPPGKVRQAPIKQDFLGQNADFPGQPWMLAGLLGCPVVAVFGIRVGWRRYRIVSRLILEKLDFRRSVREASVRDAVRRFAQELEIQGRAHPYQWFNFFDFWQTR